MKICFLKNYTGDTSDRDWFRVCSFNCVGSKFILIIVLDYCLQIRI
jgi:hypothetical protein